MPERSAERTELGVEVAVDRIVAHLPPSLETERPESPPVVHQKRLQWLAPVTATAASFVVLVVAPGRTSVVVAIVIAIGAVLHGPSATAVGRGAAVNIGLALPYQSPLVPPEDRPLVLVGVLAVALVALGRAGRRNPHTTPLILVLLYGATSVASAVVSIGESKPTVVIGFLAVAIVMVLLGASMSAADMKVASSAVVGLATGQVGIALLTTPLNNAWVRTRISASDPFDSGTYSFPASPNLILGHDFVRASGSVGHPLPFGLFVSLAAILALFNTTIFSRRTNLILALILIGGILLSGSRTPIAAGILGWAAAVVATRAHRDRGRSPTRWLETMVISAAGLSALILYARFALANAETYSRFSLSYRLSAVDSLSALIHGRPLESQLFGSGQGSTLILEAQGVVNLQGTHQFDNEWVTIFAWLGLAGLLVMVLVASVAIVRGKHAIRGILVTLVAIFLSFDVLNWVLFLMIFWMFVGLSHTNAARGQPTVKSHRDAVPRSDLSRLRPAATRSTLVQ